MDRVRYVLGIVVVLAVPLGLLYWIVIHTWSRWWRTMGPSKTYLIVLSLLAALGLCLFRMRTLLLGQDLGFNWGLIVIALVICCPMMWLELRYWKHLSFSTLVGLPEISQRRPSKLLQDGVYGVVRHPRYLSTGIGLLAEALFVNYAGVYLVILLALPAGYLLLILEERDLVGRFGDAYRDYQRNVPRLIPRLPIGLHGKSER